MATTESAPSAQPPRHERVAVGRAGAPRAGNGPANPVAFEVQARYRRPERLRVGGPATDFELVRLDTLDTSHGDQRVRLSSFQGDRPVVLFFGSYT